MSHKTGKRVLTASTSLALAVVGLAASPLAAYAAPSQGAGTAGWVNGCGINDSLLVNPGDQLTQISLDGSTWTPITFKGVDTTGNQIVDLSGLSGLYETNAASSNYNYVAKNVYLANTARTTTVIAAASTGNQASAAKVSNTPCTLAVGPAPVGLDPALETQLNGKVQAPAATATPGSVGGTVTLYKTAGVKWSVNDGVTTQNFASATMAATQTVTVSGANVTVTATPEAPSGVTLINPSGFTWGFTLNGRANTTSTPATATGAVYAATLNQITLTPGATVATDHWQWFVTNSSVTTPSAAAATTPLADGATSYVLTSADAGTTKKVWAIPQSGYQFSDGSLYKVWDISVPSSAGIVVDPAQFTYTDTQATDSVTVPAISGAKLYYQFSASAPTAANTPTFNADGTIAAAYAGNAWTPLPTGATTVLGTHANNDKLYIIGTTVGTSSSFAYKPGLLKPDAAWAAATSADFPPTVGRTVVGLASPAGYTTGAVASITYPTFVDAAGYADDSVTFPPLSGDVTWALNVYPVGGTLGAANLIDPAKLASVMGQTLKRADWVKLTYSTGGAAVNSAQDLVFEFTPTGAGGASLPAGLDSTKLKGSLYIAGGTTANEPVWIDQAGTTAPDFVRFTQIPNVQYTLFYDQDNNGTWDNNGGAGDLVTGYNSSGVKIISVPAGAKVKVEAIATAGNLSANDPGETNKKTFYHQFTTGSTGVVPVAPTANDQPGASSDTYTIPSTVGVDYYVNGAIKVAGTYSTGGASTVAITAQAQSGYTIAQGATTSWTLPFETPNNLGDVAVGNNVIGNTPPTAKFQWGAANATSYDVTYYKVLGNGKYGPELPWLTDTTETSANFVAMPGDEYIIKVTAMNDAGQTKSATSGVKFTGGNGLTDITSGVGTFNGPWQQLTNLKATQNLPYFNDTAALGYTNATWTVTLPAGKSKFDLYATVHGLGAKGKIQVNGQNWADFSTNSADWGQVSDPYSYPVRTIGGWDSSKSVTIKVIATDAGTKYLALDAYKAY